MPGLDFSFMYPMYPVIASIAMILCLIAVPPHYRVGNLAIVSLAMWTSIGLLMTIVNTCVWRGNIRNPYPIWGDIVTTYECMLGPAIASCMLYVQYRLWSVARVKSVFITKREKRVQSYVAIFFCFVIPIIIDLLHYVVQGHRYDLVEDMGPIGVIYNTWVALIIYYSWEPLLCLISTIFAMHTIALFITRRKELDIALSSGSININKNRYIRLMLLAVVSICVHFPLASWTIIISTVYYPVYPWISWEDTHSNYHRIQYYTRWFSLVLCGISVFIFFGFGEEATRQYKHFLRKCLDLFGIDHQSSRPRDVTPAATIPQFKTDEVLQQFPADDSIDMAASDYQETTEMHQGYASTNSSKHGDAREDSNIVEEKVERPSGSGVANIERDLEAQPVSAIEQQRRREILEKNPELTEELTF